MDTYRRQLAAQLAQALVMRGAAANQVAKEAAEMAAAISARLDEFEAEEAVEREATSTKCVETHPLDGARCVLDTVVEHDLHRDERGRQW